MKLLVAIKNKNGSCIEVLKCANVNENEYNSLLNQAKEYQQAKDLVFAKLEKKLNELTKKCNALEKEIKFLKGEDE